LFIGTLPLRHWGQEFYCVTGASSITFAVKMLRRVTRLLAEGLFLMLQMAWGWAQIDHSATAT
jgi:hypothetical protein